jgi:2-polyprenyl-3-methyl-5-hydroxy-6-metoxy-1,4-benzoquinol methylase
MIKTLIITPSGNDGTSFYRAFGPFNRMVRDNQVSIIDGTDKNIDWQIMSQVDLVFMQRPFANEHCRVAELCEVHRVPLIIDYDDDLFSVDVTNPAFDIYDNEQIRDNIRYICGKAQQVWLSTHHLKEVFSEFSKSCVVVQNAIDLEYFPIHQGTRRKVIAYRGGGSHEKDFLMYKDDILATIKKYSDYDFAFFGYCPDFVKENVPAKKLKIFQFSTPWMYIRNLCELRPEVMYVPLKHTFFNQSKSDIAFLEATVAGAITVAPDFVDSFGIHNSILWQYTNEVHHPHVSFKETLRKAIDSKDKIELINKAQNYLVEKRSLTSANYRRMNLMEGVLLNYDRGIKIDWIEDAVPATIEEFYNFEINMGVSLWNEDYRAKVSKIVDNLMKEFKPSNFIDVGAGCGIYVSEFLKRGVTAFAVEPNDLHKVDWDMEYPNNSENFVCADFLNVDFEDTVADLGFCIEVMEHLPEEVIPTFIRKLSLTCKYLVFSSTPYADNPAFDVHWGHISLKPENQWIDLFEANGFVHLKKFPSPAPWGLLFISS